MNGKPWRILFTGSQNGPRNMAIDKAVFHSVAEGLSPPTLRLYGWEPYCVSLGYFQDPSVEFDFKALAERGWDFVLRPTGGRAVLHAEEITYSFSSLRNEAPWCETLALSHAKISQAWSEAFSEFHLQVSEGKCLEKPRRSSANLPCFASTSRSELAHAGRKVVGSAQRRTRTAFLQHGSMPLTPEHERLVEVLKLSSEERVAHLEELKRHAISLGEISPIPEELETWTQHLALAFCKAMEIPFTIENLSEIEMQSAETMEEQHRQWQADFFGKQESGSGGKSLSRQKQAILVK